MAADEKLMNEYGRTLETLSEMNGESTTAVANEIRFRNVARFRELHEQDDEEACEWYNDALDDLARAIRPHGIEDVTEPLVDMYVYARIQYRILKVRQRMYELHKAVTPKIKEKLTQMQTTSARTNRRDVCLELFDYLSTNDEAMEYIWNFHKYRTVLREKMHEFYTREDDMCDGIRTAYRRIFNTQI